MKISLLTPTYNRANLLPRLYQSIKDNVKYYPDVEWLIMDDGSTHDTQELVLGWQKENKVKIKYYYQSNAGKMMALNNLIEYATGDIIIEIDSDDYLVDRCLKYIDDDYQKIKDDDSIYGLLYLRKFTGSNKDNKLPFEGKTVSLFDLYYKYNYKIFDTTIVFKADIRKKYRHHLERNEKFITEARMYHEIEKKYKGLYPINKEIIVCEYYDDGYTKNILKLFKNNPHGYYEYFKELLSFRTNEIIFKKRIYMIKHYILFCTLTKKRYIKSIKNAKGFLNKLLIIILYFPGKIMTRIKMR